MGWYHPTWGHDLKYFLCCCSGLITCWHLLPLLRSEGPSVCAHPLHTLQFVFMTVVTLLISKSPWNFQIRLIFKRGVVFLISIFFQKVTYFHFFPVFTYLKSPFTSIAILIWEKMCESSDLSWVYGCVSCALQVQGPWRELQFNPNEWGHYVSAYNMNKLCKWICCYTTMPLLSKHKQYCTNGQMFRMLKYDETCSRGGIPHFTYSHIRGNCARLQKSPLCKRMNHWPLPRAQYFNEIIFWPALTYFYGTC